MPLQNGFEAALRTSRALIRAAEQQADFYPLVKRRTVGETSGGLVDMSVA